MQIKLDTGTHDLDFTGGNFTLIEGADEIAQKLRVRYQFFKGEWFLDQRVGVPYFQTIFVKGVPETVIRTTMVNVALTTPGVANVEDYEFSLDAVTRAASISFRAILEDLDEPLDFSLEFILP